MGIDINLYRACIGMFNTYKFSREKFTSYPSFLLLWSITLLLYHFFKTNFPVFNNVMHQRSFLNLTFFIFQSIFYLWHISMLIYFSGDIETNPGPVTNFSQDFKICHWNLNTLGAELGPVYTSMCTKFDFKSC